MHECSQNLSTMPTTTSMPSLHSVVLPAVLCFARYAMVQPWPALSYAFAYMQCKQPVQYSTVQYSAVQCSAVQCSAVQCSAVQYSTV